MYGEPRKIRQVAERLEARAGALRAQARELHARSETVAWVSVAADRMRGRAQERRDELHRVADAYEEAALRVRAHADRVQQLVDLIAAVERRAASMVDGLVDGLVDGPPAGHRRWLELAEVVPGLRP